MRLNILHLLSVRRYPQRAAIDYLSHFMVLPESDVIESLNGESVTLQTIIMTPGSHNKKNWELQESDALVILSW